MHFRRRVRRLTAALVAGAMIAASGMVYGAESFQQGLDAYLQGDYQKAMEIWKPAAEAGDQVAAFNVGVLYAQGLGVEADPEEAVRWYRQSALAGYPNAQFNLGAAYYHGQGTKVNLAQAASWWEKAAQQDHPEALFNLATLYRRGEGVTQDTGRAMALFKRAADLGDSRAQDALADLRTKRPAPSKGTEGAGTAADSGAVKGNGGAEVDAEKAGSTKAAGAGRSQDSVAHEDPDRWTIQLFAAEGRQAAESFVQNHGLAGKVRIYQARVNGKTWFKGIYGSYPDKADAAAAQAGLQKKLSGASPWLRSFRAIQAEALPGTTVETTSSSGVAGRSDAGGGTVVGSGSKTKPEVPKEDESGPTIASVPPAGRSSGKSTPAATGETSEQVALRTGQSAFNAQDYQTAFKAWRPLAQEGVAEAQYGIAFMYESGWGVDKDYSQAFHWYSLAAQQGHVKSEFNLGMLYMNGEGVSKNQALGLYWIQSAADRGDDRAATYLKNLD